MKNIFKVEGKFSIFALIVNIIIPFGGSTLISFFSRSGEGYDEAIKPVFAPPGFVFGIVWPILYIFMGIAAYRVYMKFKNGIETKALLFYGIQLILNFIWPIIYFKFNLYGLAFIEIIILLIFMIITAVEFFKVDRIAGVLFIPYILWVVFAAALNFSMWYLNEA